MASTAGVDLKRGRPTPPMGTTEEKLQARKLDALRRGIHRVVDADALPYGVHVIGIGGAGRGVIECLLREAPEDLLAPAGSRFSALVVDIGEEFSDDLQSLSARFDANAAHVESIALKLPSPEAIDLTLQRYRSYLELEYPLLQGAPEFRSWLDANEPLPSPGEPLPRALAKLVYGSAYYEGERPMYAALKRFESNVNATQGDAVVCIVFGMGGGTGSGIALDLARHLSNGIFGRRVLVTGIGIATCDGDSGEHRGAGLFPVLNELDCLCDETQNRGVVQACGELFKNPFTAGFLVVPQQPTFARTKSLAETHARVNSQLAALLGLRHGANLWEVLRLLNWVAAPSTQHSAARTPWGSKWMHVLGFEDQLSAPTEATSTLRSVLGLMSGYVPEFIELRASQNDDLSNSWASALDNVFTPEVSTVVASGGASGSVQFVLPRVAKMDLELFFDARDAYDRLSPTERLRSHSLLLERGVILCEPSTRLEGLAGAGLHGSSAWVGIKLDDMRGPSRPAALTTRSVSHAT